MNQQTHHRIDRRNLMRGTVVTLALPLLSSLASSSRGLAEATTAGYHSDGVPRRMVCICQSLGFHSPNFIPEGTGYDYKPSRYTQWLDGYRNDFTVFSGLSHPEVDGGHSAEKVF